MKGTYHGYYKHLSKLIPEHKRSQAINFVIQIENFDNKYFTGTVEDDLSTDGMEGTGLICGTIKGDKISFIKEMPINTYYTSDFKKKYSTNKHPKIYYKGHFDAETGSYKGTWKFKLGLSRINGKLALNLPIKGYWEMKKIALNHPV